MSLCLLSSCSGLRLRLRLRQPRLCPRLWLHLSVRLRRHLLPQLRLRLLRLRLRLRLWLRLRLRLWLRPRLRACCGLGCGPHLCLCARKHLALNL